jgi:chromate transport protein ChrA
MGGAVAAIVGAVLPASFLTVAATQLFLQFRDAGAAKAALQSVQPVTLGMLVVMVIRLAP